MSYTRKHRNNPKGRGAFLRGWSKQQPGTHQRTVMMRKCGKKCFLGPNKTFPICTKNTCSVNKKGLYAAYIRAREWSTIRGTKKYAKIAKRAKSMIKRI
jgi:hypothetical protein